MALKSTDMTGEQLAKYQASAKVEYEKRLRVYENNQQAQTAYGKWMLSSLLAMNGGAIIGIAATGNLKPELFVVAAPLFAAGVLFSLLAGLFAWKNWDTATSLFRDLADPKMRHGPEWDPKALPGVEEEIEENG